MNISIGIGKEVSLAVSPKEHQEISEAAGMRKLRKQGIGVAKAGGSAD